MSELPEEYLTRVPAGGMQEEIERETKMIPKRFLALIKEMADGGYGEYGDGTPMTEDARLALEEIKRLTAIADRLTYYCYSCGNPLDGIAICLSCA